MSKGPNKLALLKAPEFLGQQWTDFTSINLKRQKKIEKIFD